jgi:hypothetical protein
MPDASAFVPSIAIGLVLFTMLWFALGTQRNIRKGNDVLRWLQAGLPILGRRTTLRWLGSSAVELGIIEPAAPFREATVVVVLEPRDVALLWAWARWRGRRDFIIVRANLRNPPRFSLDVGDPAGWTGRIHGTEREGGEGNGGSGRADAWPDGAVAIGDAGADQVSARAAWQRLRSVVPAVWRLTVQPVVPHLEVHVLLPADGIGADRVVGPVRDLAIELARH